MKWQTKKSLVSTIVLFGALTNATIVQAQTNAPGSVKNKSMEVTPNTNKAIIQDLYERIMNGRRLEQISDVVSESYTSASGEQGVDVFSKGISNVLHAFPDAQWSLLELAAEGNSVFVKQRLTGTHTGPFQGIAPTGERVSNDGFVIYTLANGKIVRHEIQTDRLGFLQQLGVISTAETTRQDAERNVFFVDKFLIPNAALEVFTERMNYNRKFIRTLPGFVRDEAITRPGDSGETVLMTIAVWESRQHLESAKQLVQAEYQRIGFNPPQFTQSLGITMEREMYGVYRE